MSKIVPKMLQLDSLPLDLWLIITTTNELIKPIAIKSHALVQMKQAYHLAFKHSDN